MEKLFVGADDLSLMSLRLAKAVRESDFSPSVMIALWRGGSLVGVVVDEAFRYWRSPLRSFPLKVSSYSGSARGDVIEVFGFEDIASALSVDDRVLIVDDVYDSGRSAEHVRGLLEGIVADVRVATIFMKPSGIITGREPDFVVERTDEWIVFPHELEELPEEEIVSGKGDEWLRLLKE